ncbi:MAG: hypothetical protein II023_03390, partial [Prevotella sp.]|nr:hypothetical protein [Prevotella sp.]
IIKKEAAFHNVDKMAAAFLKKHPMPSLTTTEKEEIDKYWRRFGIKFPHYKWFEMYYGVTGIHDPRFIPDMIAGHIIFPYYNDRQFLIAWADKNFFERFLPNIQFPKTLGRKYKGSFYDENWNYFSKDNLLTFSHQIMEKMEADTSFVLKITRNSAAGKGVKVHHVNTPQDILSILESESSPNFIIQRKIQQHPFLQQFNKTSVNILRIISWKHDNQVDILSVSIRFGIEGSFTDVAYVNGEEIVNVVGVDAKGRVNNKYASLDGLSNNVSIHLKNEEIPCFNEITSMIKDAHLQLQPFDIIGWDITINEKCEPVCIEYNVMWPGTILYQYANGPFAGDLTDKFLSFLEDKNNQKTYIPKPFRV